MTTPETFKALLAANSLPPRVDFKHRTRNLCDNINEFIYKSAHEPSLAGHRIQEHCYKTVPILSKERQRISSVNKKLNGVLFDLDYTDNFLIKLDESVQNSHEARELISELASKISSIKANTNRNG